MVKWGFKVRGSDSVHETVWTALGSGYELYRVKAGHGGICFFKRQFCAQNQGFVLSIAFREQRDSNCVKAAHVPLSCPGSRFSGFHPSTLTSSDPHTLPPPILRTSAQDPRRVCPTHGSRSQIITISSSLPLASHLPECAQRTVSTGPVCIVRVHSDLGGRLDDSAAWLRMGFVLQILIRASRPPVAMRDPSGWT